MQQINNNYPPDDRCNIPTHIPDGYVWCYEHWRPERIDDAIDFPCSDTWLGYYHERGLTQRRPMESIHSIVDQAARETYEGDELLEALRAIKDVMDTMNKSIVMRQGEPRRRKDNAPPVAEVTGIRPISKTIEPKVRRRSMDV